jgi:hypothetical protein
MVINTERMTDSKRLAAQTEREIRKSRHFRPIEAKRHTVADLIERSTRELLSTKKSETQAPQAGQLAWWRFQIGDMTPAHCTPAEIAECRDALAREPAAPKIANPDKVSPARFSSASTVNRYLAVPSYAFTGVAVKEYGWIEHNPSLKVTKTREPRGRARFPDDDERECLLSVCPDCASPDLCPAVLLARSTDVRQQEVLGLRL